MGKKKRKSFYEDLMKFTLDWVKTRNLEGAKPMLSEIVGGIEMVKIELHFTQLWFVEKLVNKQLKNKMDSFVSKLAGKR